MSFTIEIGVGDFPVDYKHRSDEPTEKQLKQDLFDLSREMDRVEAGNRQRALGFAILEAVEKREAGTVTDSAPESGVDRTNSGKRDLSEHANPSDGDSSSQMVTDDADDVERTPDGKHDLSKHT